jgi:hypothetical protein
MSPPNRQDRSDDGNVLDGLIHHPGQLERVTLRTPQTVRADPSLCAASGARIYRHERALPSASREGGGYQAERELWAQQQVLPAVAWSAPTSVPQQEVPSAWSDENVGLSARTV